MSEVNVTKEMLADLMDGRLEDDYVQARLQRMRRKDKDRFWTYVEVLQERVPWDNKILLRLTSTSTSSSRQGDTGRIVKCDCGHEYGDYRVNWKLGCRVRVRRTAAEFEEVYSPAYVIPEPEWMEIREYYCPGCVAQLAVEVTPPGYPPLFDVLRTWTRCTATSWRDHSMTRAPTGSGIDPGEATAAWQTEGADA